MPSLSLTQVRAALERPSAFFSFALAAIALLIFTMWLFNEPAPRYIVAMIVLPAIYFGSAAVRPAHVSQASVQIAAIRLAIVATGSYVLFPAEVIIAVIAAVLSALGIPLDAAAIDRDVLPEVVLGAILILTLGIVYLTRYQPAVSLYPTLIAADFPEPDLRQKINNLVVQLRNDLDALDRQTEWRASEFVPLDAEVEVFRGDKRSTKVLGLYDGLRRNRASHLFVVLGDPGAGKSVALRNLARNLLNEVSPTGRIPVYINLKEWRPERAWGPNNPPNAQELSVFILGSLTARLGLTTNGARFLNTNFDRLLASGRLFLVLDSFDEIPQVLDAQDASWLVRALSSVVTQLLTNSSEGRGIVASRRFRQPEISRGEFCRLDIRPLSEVKVRRLISQQAGSPADARLIEDAIFARNPEFAAAGRNPLLLTLLIEYVNRNGGILPHSQYEVFRSHMDHNIERGLQHTDYRDLSSQEIWQITERVARSMFDELSFSLEMPIFLIKKKLKDIAEERVERVVRFLVHAYLGRSTQSGRFSFVHRRFNEFFLVQWLLEDRTRVEKRLETIPNDGRWRDALVLYSEVASKADAAWLAQYCFSKADDVLKFRVRPGDDNYSHGLHCLRFAVEAFRGRPQFLELYQTTLADFVERALTKENNILVRKNAVEATGLLPIKDADRLVATALSNSDSWVRETAFKACRYMPKLTKQAQISLFKHFLNIPAGMIIINYRDFRVSFLVSEPFKAIRWLPTLRMLEAYITIFVIIVTLSFSPTTIFLTFITVLTFSLLWPIYSDIKPSFRIMSVMRAIYSSLSSNSKNSNTSLGHSENLIENEPRIRKENVPHPVFRTQDSVMRPRAS